MSDKIKDLPCGHLNIYLALGDEGFHCSKCGRIYTDWAGMPETISRYKALVERVKTSMEIIVDTLDGTDFAGWITHLKAALQAIEEFEKGMK